MDAEQQPTPPPARIPAGHGFDENNCAEFCVTAHRFWVNGKPHTLTFSKAGTRWDCSEQVGGWPASGSAQRRAALVSAAAAGGARCFAPVFVLLQCSGLSSACCAFG